MEKSFEELNRKATDLGIPTNSGIYKPKSEAWAEMQVTNYELYRRILEEERHRRENRLWLIALLSAIASIVSALAAIITIIIYR